MSAHTPGPWRWEFSPKYKTVSLCGGKPEYDLTVMDFARVGMNGAGPRVIDYADMRPLITNASQFATDAPGREHHSHWFRLLRHPDLDLIAAAPDMYAVLRELAECSQYWSEYDVPLGIHDRITAALAKAGQ